MVEPIELKIDYEANASYVRYRQLPPGEHVVKTEDLLDDGSVTVDRDAKGDVLGIELLGFSPPVLNAGISFAHANNLGFPNALLDAPSFTQISATSESRIEGTRAVYFGALKSKAVKFSVLSNFIKSLRKPGDRV